MHYISFFRQKFLANKTLPAPIFLLIVSCGILYLISLRDYLLFHSLAELFSIAVAIAVFLLVWNTRRFMDNDFLFYIGISYLFVAFIDLLHTLAFKGMGVFENGNDDNLPTQLWIAARYLQSIALLLSPLFLRRRLNAWLGISCFIAVLALICGAIFYGYFPACYLNGLTQFKIVSEYIIIVILLIVITWLLRRKKLFEPHVFRMVMGTMVFTILAEMAFTSYINVYGFTNFLGHIFKIIATIFIYAAIIDTGLNQPFDLLFRDLKQREKQLQEAATHDPLTGLPNRVLFQDRLTQALENVRRNDYAQGDNLVGVAILDADNFKEINDTYGHAIGDSVLVQMAQRMKNVLRQRDTVSRLGGDEFALILEDIKTPRNTDRIAKKILNGIAEPMTIEGKKIVVTASLGICLFPAEGVSEESILHCADMAMYKAKEKHNDFKLFECNTLS
jgi:diguanylate cyclase (GGDEF)-like protein